MFFPLLGAVEVQCGDHRLFLQVTQWMDMDIQGHRFGAKWRQLLIVSK